MMLGGLASAAFFLNVKPELSCLEGLLGDKLVLLVNDFAEGLSLE